jgi:hypothetical protein
MIISITSEIRIAIDDNLQSRVEVFESPAKFEEKVWTLSGAYTENQSMTISALGKYIVARRLALALAESAAEHESVSRFNQPNDAADMIGCDDDDCPENAKVRVRFKSTRVRFYCHEHGSRATGIPVMKLP